MRFEKERTAGKERQGVTNAKRRRQPVFHRVGLLILLPFSFALRSQATQCYVDWGSSYLYDANGGLNPRVALSGSDVVEVSAAGFGQGSLWYRVGQLDTSNWVIQWGNSFQYDTGSSPSVAVSGSTVVEVHNGVNGVGPLWYRVGTLNMSNKTIVWGNSHEYEATGTNPSVALSGSTVIEVASAQTGAGPLWYRVGTVNASTKTIQWTSSYQYDMGVNPTVAVQGSTVVEVHNALNQPPSPLWYHVGKLTTLPPPYVPIQWGGSVQYDYGFNPTIGLDGITLVEVHDGTYGESPFWYRLGWANASQGNDVSWAISGEYDSSLGHDPSVAVSAGYVVEVHVGALGVGPLYYRVGYVGCI